MLVSSTKVIISVSVRCACFFVLFSCSICTSASFTFCWVSITCIPYQEFSGWQSKAFSSVKSRWWCDGLGINLNMTLFPMGQAICPRKCEIQNLSNFNPDKNWKHKIIEYQDWKEHQNSLNIDLLLMFKTLFKYWDLWFF